MVRSDMLRKGISLHDSWHDNMSDTPQIMRVIAANRDKLDRLLNHSLPFDSAAEAWALQASGECGKVLLKPWA